MSTRTRTLTLVSHAGSRASRPYGPSKHPVVADATELVTWSVPNKYTGESVASTVVELEDRLWRRRSLSSALSDVEVDGDTIRFDGDLPDGGSCTGPVFRIDAEHFYTPFSDGVPLISIEREDRFSGSTTRALLTFWDVESGTFAWDAVHGMVGRPYPQRDRGLPGPEHQRQLRTIFEFDQIPHAFCRELDITVLDESAARDCLDPVRILDRLVERRRKDAEGVREKLTAMVGRVEQVLATRTAPPNYLPPPPGTESVFDPFTVSTRAVDDYLAALSARDLFARPAREIR